MKSIRTIILLLFMCCSLALRAQVADFGLPFDFPVLFSGNFAELRSNHFEGFAETVLLLHFPQYKSGYMVRFRP